MVLSLWEGSCCCHLLSNPLNSSISTCYTLVPIVCCLHRKRPDILCLKGYNLPDYHEDIEEKCRDLLPWPSKAIEAEEGLGSTEVPWPE